MFDQNILKLLEAAGRALVEDGAKIAEYEMAEMAMQGSIDELEDIVLQLKDEVARLKREIKNYERDTDSARDTVLYLADERDKLQKAIAQVDRVGSEAHELSKANQATVLSVESTLAAVQEVGASLGERLGDRIDPASLV